MFKRLALTAAVTALVATGGIKQTDGGYFILSSCRSSTLLLFVRAPIV